MKNGCPTLPQRDTQDENHASSSPQLKYDYIYVFSYFNQLHQNYLHVKSLQQHLLSNRASRSKHIITTE